MSPLQIWCRLFIPSVRNNEFKTSAHAHWTLKVDSTQARIGRSCWNVLVKFDLVRLTHLWEASSRWGSPKIIRSQVIGFAEIWYVGALWRLPSQSRQTDLVCSWTTEGISAKTYINISYTLATDWLCFQGHGFKSHRQLQKCIYLGGGCAGHRLHGFAVD